MDDKIIIHIEKDNVVSIAGSPEAFQNLVEAIHRFLKSGMDWDEFDSEGRGHDFISGKSSASLGLVNLPALEEIEKAERERRKGLDSAAE